ncbi:hypothetical protein [Microbacterium gorillae]|uniref:hypothetical protein n=1 Tax=Microbacterium gorillae TaxID=1231063 RepID=UPI00058E6948|nr:hypothetical protein [Microbacterium gorillae]
MSESLPYPLPPDWPLRRGRGPRILTVAVFVIAWVVVLGLTVTSLADGSTWPGLWWTFAFLLLGLCLSVVFLRSGGEQGVPRFVNAMAMSVGADRPVDSWVHYVPEMRHSAWYAICLLITGVPAIGLAGWGAVLAIAAGGSTLWALVLVAVNVAVAAVFVNAGVKSALIRRNSRTFGKHDVGIAVGRNGVSRHLLEGISAWPWEEIADITPTTIVTDRDSDDVTPDIRLTLRNGEEVLLELSFKDVHPLLFYCVVRFWWDRPDLRDELSTTFAQQRIERWHEDLQARLSAG